MRRPVGAAGGGGRRALACALAAAVWLDASRPLMAQRAVAPSVEPAPAPRAVSPSPAGSAGWQGPPAPSGLALLPGLDATPAPVPFLPARLDGFPALARATLALPRLAGPAGALTAPSALPTAALQPRPATADDGGLERPASILALPRSALPVAQAKPAARGGPDTSPPALVQARLAARTAADAQAAFPDGSAAALSRTWDGAAESAAAASEAEASAADDGVKKTSRLTPAELRRALAGLEPVPPPRARLAKAGVALFWTAVTAAAVALHAPFGSLVPLIGGAAMALPAGWLLWRRAGSKRGVQALGAAAAVWWEAEPELAAAVAAAAESMGLPPPRAIFVEDSRERGAFVSGYSRRRYFLAITSALEELPGAVVEAVVRHELAHVRHRDTLGTAIQLWLSPLPAMVALAAGVVGAPAWAASILIVAAVLGYKWFQRLDEYLADQRAASGPAGPAPLAEFFIRESDDERLAASAASGRPFAAESGLSGAVLLALVWFFSLLSVHPPLDFRVARLARLGRRHERLRRVREAAPR